MLPLQKEEIKKLLKSGERIKAIQYTRETFNVSLKNAIRLVNTVDQEMNPGKKIDIDSLGQNRGAPKMIFYVFGSLGTLFLVIAAVLFYFDQRAANTFTRTTGEVVAMRSSSGEDGDTFAPDVAFRWDGVEVIYKSNLYSSPPSFQVGDQVELFVNPNDSSDVWINTFGERFALILVFGVLGIFFLLPLWLINKFMK